MSRYWMAWRALCSRVCQWMKSTTSQKAVVTSASSRPSQANASARVASQCRQRSTAGMQAGEVTSTETAAIWMCLASGKGMAAVVCVVGVACVLARGHWGVLAAIVLCVLAALVLLLAWRRARQGGAL